ncbi:hypothetical protein BKA70DRAFT_1236390 [Coprinopsis sp. MPI-PUGE-AT-0042]|nr:hypothetical protein BKA70DRAFT_1236390 [Coprinopsis sp. MPI-PUGE-AT-0042]
MPQRTTLRNARYAGSLAGCSTISNSYARVKGRLGTSRHGDFCTPWNYWAVRLRKGQGEAWQGSPLNGHELCRKYALEPEDTRQHLFALSLEGPISDLVCRRCIQIENRHLSSSLTVLEKPAGLNKCRGPHDNENVGPSANVTQTLWDPTEPNNAGTEKTAASFIHIRAITGRPDMAAQGLPDIGKVLIDWIDDRMVNMVSLNHSRLWVAPTSAHRMVDIPGQAIVVHGYGSNG